MFSIYVKDETFLWSPIPNKGFLSLVTYTGFSYQVFISTKRLY